MTRLQEINIQRAATTLKTSSSRVPQPHRSGSAWSGPVAAAIKHRLTSLEGKVQLRPVHQRLHLAAPMPARHHQSVCAERNVGSAGNSQRLFCVRTREFLEGVSLAKHKLPCETASSGKKGREQDTSQGSQKLEKLKAERVKKEKNNSRKQEAESRTQHRRRQIAESSQPKSKYLEAGTHCPNEAI